MTAAIEEAYGQGWNDARQAMAGRLLAALTQDVPQPRNGRQWRCQECQQPMEIGQPAEAVGRDVFSNTLWRHPVCPPINEDQADVVEDQAEAEAQPLALVRLLEPEPEPAAVRSSDRDLLAMLAPGLGEEVLLAVASGHIGGPFIITVSSPEIGDYQRARIELMDWTEFDTGRAAAELAANGFEILPAAEAGRGSLSGWTQGANQCYTAPVRPLRTELPHRVPSMPQVRPLAERGQQDLAQYKYLGPGEKPGEAHYKVVNRYCGIDRGTILMTTILTSGQIQTYRATCDTCGAEVTL